MGALVPSVEAGVAIAPAIMVIFIVFGGLYVVNTPSYLSWVPQVRLILTYYCSLKLLNIGVFGILDIADSLGL